MSPCLSIQRSPWAAACLLDGGLVATVMWLWLTACLTTPFMPHLLAVNQGSHPGAIDGAVSLYETCMSKPPHSSSVSLHGHRDMRLPPAYTFLPGCLSFFLSVSLSSPCFPSETSQSCPILVSLGPFVTCRPYGMPGDSGLIYMCFSSLPPVFEQAQFLSVCPSYCSAHLPFITLSVSGQDPASS